MAKQLDSSGTSRERILRALCIQPHVVAELAADLGISRNAVRKLLSRLESDGLVTHDQEVRGVGKPAHVYTITAAGELHVSRAYLPLMNAVLQQLQESLPGTRVAEILRHAGRRLAPEQRTGTLRQRLAAGAEALNELGGAAVLKRTGKTYRIECGCCAIAAAVVEHPIVCKSMEGFLRELTGADVRERCQRNGRPRCRFDVMERG